MKLEDFYFKDSTDEELKALYCKLHDEKESCGVLTAQGRLLQDATIKVYSELKKRGKESECAFYHMKKHLIEMDCDEIENLVVKIEKETTGGTGVFKEFYTGEGDPVCDTAGVIDCFLWFLKAEILKRKGVRNG